MEIIKIIGIALSAVVIIIIIKQYKPEFAVYISLIASALIILLVLDKLSGIVELLSNLASRMNGTSHEFLKILIKITGIAFLTEFAVNICKDSGESAIASKIDLGGKVIIVTISIPIISSMLETVLKILP